MSKVECVICEDNFDWESCYIECPQCHATRQGLIVAVAEERDALQAQLEEAREVQSAGRNELTMCMERLRQAQALAEAWEDFAHNGVYGEWREDVESPPSCPWRKR